VPSVADLVEEKRLRALAASETLDAGTKLAEQGAEKYEVELLGGEELVVHVPRRTAGQLLQALRRRGKRETWRRSPARRTGNR
jgi:hypothetical protein